MMTVKVSSQSGGIEVGENGQIRDIFQRWTKFHDKLVVAYKKKIELQQTF